MRKTFEGATLKDLKETAITVQDDMIVYFPQFSKTETLQISNLDLTPKTYAYNNGTIAFVDESKIFYAIPDFKGIQKILVENGYKKEDFYVPFSNWNYPIAYKGYWELLKNLKKAEKNAK